MVSLTVVILIFAFIAGALYLILKMNKVAHVHHGKGNRPHRKHPAESSLNSKKI